LPQQGADIVCVQELKAQAGDITGEIASPDGYQSYFHCAEKKGYSGVGIYARRQPDNVMEGVGVAEIDAEGRYLRADFGPLSVISIYFPSGSSGEHRQAAKFFFLDRFFPMLRELASCGREIILCGDWNIAHKEIDLKNWRSNQKNSGFLPEERAWLSEVFQDLGFVDIFRRINQEPEQYTWWSNRGQAWAKNVGWRIDYQIATPGIASSAAAVSIYKTERFSDHSPLIIDYDYNL
jgi:exodeoxyribonuclease-3